MLRSMLGPLGILCGGLGSVPMSARDGESCAVVPRLDGTAAERIGLELHEPDAKAGVRHRRSTLIAILMRFRLDRRAFWLGC